MKKTSVKPFDQLDHLDEIQDGLIQKDPWGIVYKVHENHIVKNYMMFLQDKHCYKSITVTEILTKTDICKMNSNDDLKCV